MNVGKLLKKLREERNLSITVVAKSLNIGVSTLSEYERNLTMPSLDRFISLVDFYGLDPIGVLKGEEILIITNYSDIGKQKAYELDKIKKNKI